MHAMRAIKARWHTKRDIFRRPTLACQPYRDARRGKIARKGVVFPREHKNAVYFKTSNASIPYVRGAPQRSDLSTRELFQCRPYLRQCFPVLGSLRDGKQPTPIQRQNDL